MEAACTQRWLGVRIQHTVRTELAARIAPEGAGTVWSALYAFLYWTCEPRGGGGREGGISAGGAGSRVIELSMTAQCRRAGCPKKVTLSLCHPLSAVMRLVAFWALTMRAVAALRLACSVASSDCRASQGQRGPSLASACIRGIRGVIAI